MNASDILLGLLLIGCILWAADRIGHHLGRFEDLERYRHDAEDDRQ